MNRSPMSPAAGDAGAPPPAAPPAATSAAAPGSAQPAPGALDPRRRVPAPAQSLPEHGRISLTLDEVRTSEVFAIGLGMPDEARGEEALPVKIAGVDGRLLEVSAPLIEGPGTGLRLEIDSEWLRPGRYLISVSTLEKKPLALRRYVLEIR